MPGGQTRSGAAEAPWHLGGPDPPRQREEQCVPQASPVPCLDSVTCHLRAQQHRDPLSAATSPLGTPTLGTATGCQRREVPGTGSTLLPSSNLGYQQPHSRTLTTKDGAEDCGGRAGPPAGALPAAERKSCSSPSLSCAPHLYQPGWTVLQVGFPCAMGSHHALSPGHTARESLGMGSPAQRGLSQLPPCPGRCPQYVWGVRMKSRSSSLRIHFMSLLTALMAPALVPRGL